MDQNTKEKLIKLLKDMEILNLSCKKDLKSFNKKMSSKRIILGCNNFKKL